MERNEIKRILYLPHLRYQNGHTYVSLTLRGENLWFQLMQRCRGSRVMFVCMRVHIKQHQILEIAEEKKKKKNSVALLPAQPHALK